MDRKDASHKHERDQRGGGDTTEEKSTNHTKDHDQPAENQRDGKTKNKDHVSTDQQNQDSDQSDNIESSTDEL